MIFEEMWHPSAASSFSCLVLHRLGIYLDMGPMLLSLYISVIRTRHEQRWKGPVACLGCVLPEVIFVDPKVNIFNKTLTGFANL